MPTMVVCRCDYCQRDRLQQVIITRRGAAGSRHRGAKAAGPAAGPTTRTVFCPFCDTSKPWGICCPKCGDCRFSYRKTSHRADGSTVRVKACRHCGHKIRTRERLESASA